MAEPTPAVDPAEIEAGAEAIRRANPHAAPQPTEAAEQVLSAVLPDHDARVRADERARVAGEILAACRCDPGPHDGPNLPCQRDAAAADPCVFCEIITGREPATVVHQWADTIAIVPLTPVTDGHLLVIPKTHIRDVSESPHIAGLAMTRAAELARPPCNIITSAGREATQSVWHLHLHIVPRREDDGLALPWWSGRRTRAGGRR